MTSPSRALELVLAIVGAQAATHRRRGHDLIERSRSVVNILLRLLKE